MIFVTVGTHEQSFNRLLEEVDQLKKEGIITDDVFIQTGFSTYQPKYCEWKKVITYAEMEFYMDIADIIITHGGPATFMGAIAKGKKPIVVPRQEKFGEHVNDHQMEFCEKLINEGYDISIIRDIKKLKDHLEMTYVQQNTFNNKKFVDSFSRIVDDLIK